MFRIHEFSQQSRGQQLQFQLSFLHYGLSDGHDNRIPRYFKVFDDVTICYDLMTSLFVIIL